MWKKYHDLNYATWNIRELGEKEEELDKILNENKKKFSEPKICVFIFCTDSDRNIFHSKTN